MDPFLTYLSYHSYFLLVRFQVKYRTFEEIEEEKRWWRLPFVSEFLRKNGFESALKKFVGSEAVPARQFVEYAFGQLKSLNDAYPWKGQFLNSNSSEAVVNSNNSVASDMPSRIGSASEDSLDETNCNGNSNLELPQTDNGALDNGHATELVTQAGETMQLDKLFWKNFADIFNQTVVQKLGLPVSLELKWDGFELLNRIGLQSQKIAEVGYVESGLATPKDQDIDSDKASGPLTISAIQSSLPDIKKATEDLLRQTDSVLGAWMVLTAAVSKLNKESGLLEKSSSESEKFISSLNSTLDENKAEEMRALFTTAESAMEAWAMLATSLGHHSFIKSEFEKICFLDNASTDTQVRFYIIRNKPSFPIIIS